MYSTDTFDYLLAVFDSLQYKRRIVSK